MKSVIQNTISKLKSNALSFIQDTSGTFTAIFGVSAISIFLSMGLAVDYSQMSRAKTLLNNSLDAAILAAGNEMLEKNGTSAQLKTVFENNLFANLGQHPELSDHTNIIEFNVNTSTGQINATLEAPVQMAVMSLLGYETIPVQSFSEATFSTTEVEISMVLDVTGSMNWDGKLDSLKLAAKDAVDILLPDGKNNSRVRLGVVPYSEGVRLSNALVTKASGQSSKKCMTERKINTHTDVSYTTEYVSAISGADCSSSKVRPLTSNATVLKGDITALKADGYTAGHLGIAWGYYMLSEKWQSLWPKGTEPANYNSKTKKIAILMTDGSFNTYFDGYESDPRDTSQTINTSNLDSIALCKGMKKAKAGGNGIEVYSIAFNAPNDAKQTLKACASEDTDVTAYFYDANSETELRTAFSEIAKSIKELRLTR